jgi:hypothetical protein
MAELFLRQSTRRLADRLYARMIYAQRWMSRGRSMSRALPPRRVEAGFGASVCWLIMGLTLPMS